MGIRKPEDIVLKNTSMPRWIKDWISSRRSINYSGLIQETLIKVIKEYDPDYYKQFEHLLPNIKRKENLPKIKI